MGCCELQNPTTYALSSNGKSIYQSILLKDKKSSVAKKSVRFEISSNNFKTLAIPEETKSPWYEGIANTDTANWKIYKANENVSLKYYTEANKIHLSLSITLNVIVGHKAIVCLINNPKYRVIWDTEIKKMDLLFGDSNLDASVIIEDHNCQKSELFERKVRKLKGIYYITYSPYEECYKKNCMVVAIYSSEKVIVHWVEDISKESENLKEKKFVWGSRLFEEIIIHKNN